MTPTADLMQEAERYFAHHDLDRAAELYRHANLQASDNPLPQVGLARIALALGYFDDAARLLDVVLIKHPDSVEALTFRGVCEDALGRSASAVNYLERAVAAAPTYGVAQYNLGRCLAQLKRWDEARARLSVAAELLADDVSVRCALGIATFRAGDVACALQTLGDCLRLAPNHLGSLLALADVLVEAGKLELADELLANGVTRLPQTGALHSKRAAIALRRKDLDLARTEAARVCELAPDDEEGWLFAATVEVMQLRLNDAEQRLRTLLRAKPHSWRAHYQLGVLYDALRAKAPAAAAYRNAIAAQPAAWEPYNNLGTLLLEEGTPASLVQARGLFERALTLVSGRDAARVHYNFALALMKRQERAAALVQAKAAARLAEPSSPLSAEASRLVGDCN